MASAAVKICEMSLRDGLQYLGGPNVPPERIVPLELRLRLVDALVAAGVRHVEVGSFVSPTGTPQMALSDELGRRVDPAAAPGLELAGLVPNEAGFRRFAATRLNMVALFPTASETHARENFRGRTVDEVLAMAAAVARLAADAGYPIRAHVSAAFQDIAIANRGSDLETVVRVCRAVLGEMGCGWLTLADTNGTATPPRIAEVLQAVGDALGSLDRVGVHLHDRNGTALANAAAAYERGVRIFDTSLTGIGGSVAASRAEGGSGHEMVGNIATESLVHLLHELGAATGIDLEALRSSARPIVETMRRGGERA